MSPEHGAPKDAVVVSPHKFPGGPGASGVLIVRYDAVTAQAPSWPGGGTVTFVSPWSHAYTHNLIAREEAGTPNIVGDIRAALAFVVKDCIGQQTITAIEARYNEMAQTGWAHNPHLEILGAPHVDRLPIYAFRVKDKHGNRIHHQLFTKMLSDIYGIQARGGCACAGPYAHRLLNIDQERSAEIEAAVRAGREIEKPGWVRLNFSYMMTPETVRYIIESVIDLAANVDKYIGYYQADDATARFAKAQDMVADAAE
jgi:selenocysteine lyase/cysteine desulfurase